MAIAPRPQDRKLVLAGFGGLAGLEALQGAQVYLLDSELAEEAGVALVQIASSLKSENRANILEAMKQVLQTVQNQDTRHKAQKLLQQHSQP
jgi:hypothetical protein